MRRLLKAIEDSWGESLRRAGMDLTWPGTQAMVTMLQAQLAPASLGSPCITGDKFARWVHYCTVTCAPAVPYLSGSSQGDAQVRWEHVLAFAAHLAQSGAV